MYQPVSKILVFKTTQLGQDILPSSLILRPKRRCWRKNARVASPLLKHPESRLTAGWNWSQIKIIKRLKKKKPRTINFKSPKHLRLEARLASGWRPSERRVLNFKIRNESKRRLRRPRKLKGQLPT